MNDLQLAFRQIARSPGFTLAVTLSLALGIGANATVLCWLRQLVLRPLPGVAAQEQLVVLVSNAGGGAVSLPDLRDAAGLERVFSGALATMSTHAWFGDERESEWLEAQIVSAGFFDVLGVRLLLGRGFRPGDDAQPGGNPVLVISERLWRRRFGSDPGIIGREMRLNRRHFTIVGVAAGEFTGTLPPNVHDVWAPLSMIWEVRNQGTYFLDRRTARGWHNLLRLQPGVDLRAARDAIAALDARLAADYPASNRDAQHRLMPLAECPWGVQTVMRPVLNLLLAVSAGVLLIVTANVGNLLLARAIRRRKEVAIRLAAGASRLRLGRLFLTESMLLALLGGAGGLLLASWLIDTIPLLLDAPQGLALDFSLDGATFALTLLLTLGTGLLFGVVPALQASRANLGDALKAGGRASTDASSHHRLRGGLVVTEIAVALVLLAGTVLCLAGLRQAGRIDFGLNPAGVLVADMQIGMNGYTAETGPSFYRRLRERLAALPGVDDAALASWLPLGLRGCKGMNVTVDGYERPPGENPTCEYAIVSPRYFATLGVPLPAGRDFADTDDDNRPPVAIVNDVFARRFWPGQAALGRQFKAGGKVRTIIGIARTGKYNRLDEAPACFFYLPAAQGVPDLDLGLCVRTAGDPEGFAAAIRQAVRELDPQVELLRTATLRAHTQTVLAPQRVAATLLTVLSGVALTLAAMGVYAVMAYAVNERMHEFGVRVALGASVGDVLGLVMRQGLSLALAGVAIGTGIAVAAGRLMKEFLFGADPFDPIAYLGVIGLLAAIALLACWVPARRATRVDPIKALRTE